MEFREEIILEFRWLDGEEFAKGLKLGVLQERRLATGFEVDASAGI